MIDSRDGGGRLLFGCFDLGDPVKCERLDPEMGVLDQFALNRFGVMIIDDSLFKSGAAIDLDP